MDGRDKPGHDELRIVMPGLVPGIHDLREKIQMMDIA
jgi:hypothetical protein